MLVPLLLLLMVLVPSSIAAVSAGATELAVLRDCELRKDVLMIIRAASDPK